jgi:hypothetical protein
MSLILSSNFDISKVTFSDVKSLEKSKMVYMNYNGGKFRTQTPQMPIPFTASDYNNNHNFKVSLSFRDLTSSDPTAKARATAFHAMLQAIDDLIIDKATANAGKWLGAAGASRAEVKRLYTHSIRVPKTPDGTPRTDVPPSIGVALKQKDGVFDAELYDKDLRSIMKGTRFASPLDHLVRGTEVVCQLDLTSIWLAAGKFGTTWKLHHAWVRVPGASNLKGVPNFVMDDGSAIPAATTATASSTAVSATEDSELLLAAMGATAAAADEAEEEEEEEEEAAEEAVEEEVAEEEIPAPPVPKRTTVARTASVAAPPVAPVAPVAAAAAGGAGGPAVKKVVKKIGTTKSA